MEDGGLVVLDGTQLRDSNPEILPTGSSVTGSRILEAVESSAAAALFGLSLPEPVKAAALQRMGSAIEGFRSSEFGKEEADQKSREYITALADQLRDDPLVISVLDGSSLRLFLDDEDDFAMLAENLFTDLDTEDTGKLKKKEIRNALGRMGVDMGVPPFSESDDLITDILMKHGAEGEEELGQAQFAQLLQPVLQDLADALVKNPVTVIQNIKILNGSKLRQILANAVLFDDVTKKMFDDWKCYNEGEGNIDKLQGFLESKALELGLPTTKSNEAIVFLYNQILLGVENEQVNSELDMDTFRHVMKYVLEKFAEQLEATPIFVDPES